jgi:hypothetical protein
MFGKIGKVKINKLIPARFEEYMPTIIIKERFEGKKYAVVPQMSHESMDDTSICIFLYISIISNLARAINSKGLEEKVIHDLRHYSKR